MTEKQIQVSKIPEKYKLAKKMGEAIRYGNFNEIEILIGKGVRIEDAEGSGEKPALAKAASMGNLKAVEMLLENRQNPNATDPFGMSAMHQAARNNSTEILEKLEASGGNIKAKSDGGETVLSHAVIWRASKAVAWLVNKGADPFEPMTKGRTAMDIAQEIGATECIAVFSAILARNAIEKVLNSMPSPRV